MKRILCLLLLFFFEISMGSLGCALFADSKWYSSNPGGMAMTPMIGPLALRNDYALSVETLPASAIPGDLRKYSAPSLSLEKHCLFEKGQKIREQLLLLYGSGKPRFVCAYGPDGDGFLEVYNNTGRIIEERRFEADGSGLYTHFSYSKDGTVLLQVEYYTIDVKEPPKILKDEEDKEEDAKPEQETLDSKPEIVLVEPEPEIPPPPPWQGPALSGIVGPYLYFDDYKYNRSMGLRHIERVFAQTAPADAIKTSLVSFPRVLSTERSGVTSFVRPGAAYNTQFFNDLFVGNGFTEIYKTDNRNRILNEKRIIKAEKEGEEDKVIGEFTNTWHGDRVISVIWTSGEPGSENYDERQVDYEYDERGNRIGEKDYNKGVLEREIVVEGGVELESIYMNGKLVLQATWQNGNKIKEEKPETIEPNNSGQIRTPRRRL